MRRAIVALLTRMGILATPEEDALYSYLDDVEDGIAAHDPYTVGLLAAAARDSRAKPSRGRLTRGVRS